MTNLWDVGAWNVQDLKDAGPTLVGLLALIVTPAVTLIVGLIQSRRAQKVADMQAATSLKVAAQQADHSLKVANKQIIAPMRQAWINTLRDHVSEFTQICSWFVFSRDSLSEQKPGPDYNKIRDEMSGRQVEVLIKLKLMLNRGESDHVSLIQTLDLIDSITQEEVGEDLQEAMVMMEATCARIFKAEWTRVKSEM